MKVAILGAGAMGSWFGGKLALGGHDVSLLTTNEAHREAVDAHGLTLKSGDQSWCVRLPIMDPSDYAETPDAVLLFTKSFQSDEALSAIADSFGETTQVLSLQNGLGNAEVIARYLPLERIMVGVTMMPIDRIAPGVVESTGHGESWFHYALKRESEFVDALEKAFVDAGLEVRLDADIHRRIWSKVAFNAGMNAICALVHGTPGTIHDSPGAQALVNDVAREVATVAAAEGLDLDLDAISRTIDFACTRHRDHKPSMRQDLLEGKRTEVDAINGAVVAAGKRLGVPTPLNDILTTLVKVAEISQRRT
jgi:2-dehydropantoate 2-reductase